jgi:tetratricopeptide (TPR) repeat protein
MDIFKRKQKKVNRLTKKGYQYVDEGEYEKALEIAKKLEKLRFSSTFEIAGLAYAGLDNLEEAVNVLKEGVEAAPDVWSNWQLLGNYLSDLEHFEEAEKVYQHALKCPEVDKSSIALNQAILASRMDRFDKTLELLRGVVDEDLFVHKKEVEIIALEGKGQIDRAFALAVETLNLVPLQDKNEETLGRIAARACRLRLAKGEDKAIVRNVAIEALDVYFNHTELFAVICEIDNLYSKEACNYRLLVNNRFPEPHPYFQYYAGYYVNYHVIADSLEEAETYMKEFENRISPHASIEEFEKLEPCPDAPKGVFWKSILFAYEKEDE